MFYLFDKRNTYIQRKLDQWKKQMLTILMLCLYILRHTGGFPCLSTVLVPLSYCDGWSQLHCWLATPGWLQSSPSSVFKCLMLVIWLSHGLPQQTEAQQSDSGWLPSRVLVVEVNTTRDVSFITLQMIFRPNQSPLSISVFFCLCIANGCTLSSSRNGSWSRFIICCLTAENTPQSKRYSQTAVSMWRGHILLLPGHNDAVLSYLRGLSNYYKVCGSRHLVIGSILTILKHLTPYATATRMRLFFFLICGFVSF